MKKHNERVEGFKSNVQWKTCNVQLFMMTSSLKMARKQNYFIPFQTGSYGKTHETSLSAKIKCKLFVIFQVIHLKIPSVPNMRGCGCAVDLATFLCIA